MKNEIEVIDGVKGEWRTVTKPSEVKVGQRVRYLFGGTPCGYKEVRTIHDRDGRIGSEIIDGLFIDTGMTTNIQAFFPLPVRKSRKVAKVRIRTWKSCGKAWFETTVMIPITSREYANRKNAIRGAKRFCKAIGYECEIVK
jgi:hypothetical protein